MKPTEMSELQRHHLRLQKQRWPGNCQGCSDDYGPAVQQKWCSYTVL